MPEVDELSCIFRISNILVKSNDSRVMCRETSFFSRTVGRVDTETPEDVTDTVCEVLDLDIDTLSVVEAAPDTTMDAFVTTVLEITGFVDCEALVLATDFTDSTVFVAAGVLAPDTLLFTSVLVFTGNDTVLVTLFRGEEERVLERVMVEDLLLDLEVVVVFDVLDFEAAVEAGCLAFDDAVEDGTTLVLETTATAGVEISLLRSA